MARVRPDAVAADESSQSAGRFPRWLPPLSLVLAIIGLLISIYLTYEHFTGSHSLVCSETAQVNCTKVTTSIYSAIVGVPVALLGLLFFIAMTVLCLPPVWHRAPAWVATVRLAATVIGMLMVFYLLWAEFFRIHAICLWCSAVHVTTFLLLIVLVLGSILTDPESDSHARAR